MRVAIGIEYAGNAFEGWQTQPHGRTVQDFLERALAQIAQHYLDNHYDDALASMAAINAEDAA